MPETRTLRGVVTNANKEGVKVGDRWYNYGRTYEGEPLGRDAVSRSVELVLVASKKDGKSYVRAAKLSNSSAPEKEAPEQTDPAPDGSILESAPPANGQAADTASAEALKYASDLAAKAGIATEDLESLVRLRFRKEWSAISRSEASSLIVFLGGFDRSKGRRS